jgi:hypothetical protein
MVQVRFNSSNAECRRNGADAVHRRGSADRSRASWGAAQAARERGKVVGEAIDPIVKE